MKWRSLFLLGAVTLTEYQTDAGTVFCNNHPSCPHPLNKVISGWKNIIGSFISDLRCIPRDRVEMCAAALSPSSHTGGLYKVHHNTVGVTDKGAGSIGAIPGIGFFVDHNRFASTHASVTQGKSHGFGKVPMTSYIGGVLYRKV